jgi:hypothetical protein
MKRITSLARVISTVLSETGRSEVGCDLLLYVIIFYNLAGVRRMGWAAASWTCSGSAGSWGFAATGPNMLKLSSRERSNGDVRDCRRRDISNGVHLWMIYV